MSIIVLTSVLEDLGSQEKPFAYFGESTKTQPTNEYTVWRLLWSAAANTPIMPTDMGFPLLPAAG